MTDGSDSENRAPALQLDITYSRYFQPWFLAQNFSLALTTYQTNRLFFIGCRSNGALSAFERIFERAMGLHCTPERLYLSSRYQLWQLDNMLAPGQLHRETYDRVFVPRIGYTTGDLDAHDIGVMTDPNAGTERVAFVNTRYSCLATTSDRYSFRELWHPPFISKVVPEDRCHLNGLAMVAGEPRYMTAVSRSDVADGWRERRERGGCLLDIHSNEVVLADLSMPHSPRWYRDRLWLLNSGTGELGVVDLATGTVEPVAFCPGFLRGLAFWEDFAIVGLSKPRRNRTFAGLALDERLAEKDASAWCGVMFVDLNTGNIAHWIKVEGTITEFYDVQILPGVKYPMALGFRTDEICHFITPAPVLPAPTD